MASSVIKKSDFPSNLGYQGGVDANSFTQQGTYHVGIATNSPVSGTFYGLLIVFSAVGSTYKGQLAIGANSYTRYCENGTWQAWKKITP